MASHLSVTTSNAGATTTKSFGTPADSGGEDVFAAMLDASGANTIDRSRKPSSDAINMSLGFEADEKIPVEDPELVAVAIDATIPIVQAEVPKAELTELIEGLADLKARLEAGETLDGKELERLDAMLGKLAQQLDIDLADMPTSEELAALLAKPGSTDTLAGKLADAFAPVASALLGNADTDASAELSAQIKSVGDKLAAVLSALNEGKLDADQLARLEQDAATDTDLKAALDRLLKPAIAADAAPMLATPKLEITEAALTGKASLAADAAPAADDAAEPADSGLKLEATAKPAEPSTDRDTEQKSDDKPDADIKPVATAATADKQPADTAVAAQPAQTARADAVAAPRVVQAGYQTSQQQLNLPQLAFEMVRQVGEGNTRFQIRLDPAELGKIDVRLDIDASGQVNARLTVEKAETLDLMQRDQRALERALQQAGLDGSKTNLEFSLKQNPFAGQQGQDGNARQSLFGDGTAEAVEETPLPTVNLYRGNLSASGVNIVA